MAGKTTIEWTDTSANPVRARNSKTGAVGWACVKTDAACLHCYSERMNLWVGTGLRYTASALRDVEFFLDENVLLSLLRSRKRGERTFIGDMTDLFGPFVRQEWRDQIVAVAALTPERTYQFLTKRAEDLHRYFTDPELPARVAKWIAHYKALVPALARLPDSPHFPLFNAWLGVTAGVQKSADVSIPWLLKTPAAVHYVSCEPLLEMLDLTPYLTLTGGYPAALDLVIAGFETGKVARPGHVRWLRSLRDQCAAADVDFFFKSWGEYIPRIQIANVPRDAAHPWIFRPPWSDAMSKTTEWGVLDIHGHYTRLTTAWNGREDDPRNDYEIYIYRLGRSVTGRLLDGREHNDLPGKLDRRDHPEIRQGLLL